MYDYDVVIVGGSFAGLATAMQLRGRRVLVIDQRPIGAHQTSTCGIPLPTVQAVGTEPAIQEVHDSLVLHTGGREIRFALPTPYVTFHYETFCRTMLTQTDATVLIARVTGAADGAVLTSQGPVAGRFVVDATGWQGLPAAGGAPARTRATIGYGVETELPGRHARGPGLHFYYEREFVRNGYAWVFPCGESTRLGICTFEKGLALGPPLARHLARFGLDVGATHGGVLATGRRAPLEDGRLVVGDAAGLCLPLTGEGIRTAIVSGVQAGQILAAALAGRLSDDTARAQYAAQVHRTVRFQAGMQLFQQAVARTPDALRAGVGRLVSPPPLIRPLVRAYQRGSGWLAPDAARQGSPGQTARA